MSVQSERSIRRTERAAQEQLAMALFHAGKKSEGYDVWEELSSEGRDNYRDRANSIMNGDTP